MLVSSVVRTSPWRADRQLGIALPLVALVALAFGGGGSAYPLANLLAQIFALGALLLLGFSRAEGVRRMPRALIVLAFLTMLLPLLQLVPLPPGIWQALPGRDLVEQSLALIGRSDSWFAWSVDRSRTLVAFASLIPVLAVLALFPWGRRGAATAVLYLIVAMGLANFLFGALQLAIPGGLLNPYPVLSDGRLYGFFANHNSAGLFFVIALCASIGAFQMAKRRSVERNVLAGAALIFVLGTVLTNSRSSTTLLLLPLALIAWIALLSIGDKRRRLKMGAIGFAAIALVGAGAAWLLSNTRLATTAERFGSLEDHRPEIWEDSLVSAERFWPVGSGTGTFRDVFPVDESLEYVLAGNAGRAHSEYLEVAIESGIVGLLLIAAWVLFLAWAVFRARNRSNWPVVRAAGLAGLCIFLQAFLDYPLRNQAMLCVAGLLIAAMVGRERRDKGS